MRDISYLLGDEIPAPGELLPVADGIYWLRMGLPMQLDHINLYVLEDEAGWWIVDTGMKTSDTRKHWRTLLDGPLAGKPVIGVLLTHLHPDHIGQAGWLCERFDVLPSMSHGEYFQARTMSAPTPEEGPSWAVRSFMRKLGLDPERLKRSGRKFRGMGALIEPLPGGFRRLRAADVLPIGGRQWQVHIGRGHSPEHVCLFDPAEKVLISGDQVIPKITSNVSVMPSEPYANPLQDWLQSIDEFMALPDECLILPAHNAPFYGLHRRLTDLKVHHQQHLNELLAAADKAQSALEYLPVLFKRKLDDSSIFLALGECLAHLNYLLEQGRMLREVDAEGTWRFVRHPDIPKPEIIAESGIKETEVVIQEV